MRTAAAALLLACVLAAPAAGAPPRAPAGTWSGSWQNGALGASGGARLVGGTRLSLRLDGAALGCAAPTLLPVAYARGALTGRGRDLSCNAGLRWSLSGRFTGGVFSGVLAVRLADGTRATLSIGLLRSSG